MREYKRSSENELERVLVNEAYEEGKEYLSWLRENYYNSEERYEDLTKFYSMLDEDDEYLRTVDKIERVLEEMKDNCFEDDDYDDYDYGDYDY